MNYTQTLREQVDIIMHGAVAILPSVVIAIAVLFVTWIAARVARQVAGKIAARARLRPDLHRLSEVLAKLGVWIAGILIAAAVVIPGLTPASLFAGLGFGAVAIGFAFKDIFENFLAGVLIMLREKMQIGDVVKADGIVGKVEAITLRETHIRQFSGELTILPNSTIFQNPVEILTDQVERRNEVVIGVSYDTDLPKAEKAIRQAVEGVAGITAERGVDIYAQEFNSSSIDFLVRWWTDTAAHDYLGIKSDVVFAIKRALDEAGIEIPFPYVTHTFKEDVPLAEAA